MLTAAPLNSEPDKWKFYIQPNRSTIKSQSTRSRVLPHLVFGHALVSPRIILLEAGDLQHGIGVLHFDFAGEGDAISPLPSDLWDGAGRDRQEGNFSRNSDLTSSEVLRLSLRLQVSAIILQ